VGELDMFTNIWCYNDDFDVLLQTLDVTICQTDDMDETEAESNLMRYTNCSYDTGKQGWEYKLQEMAES